MINFCSISFFGVYLGRISVEIFDLFFAGILEVILEEKLEIFLINNGFFFDKILKSIWRNSLKVYSRLEQFSKELLKKNFEEISGEVSIADFSRSSIWASSEELSLDIFPRTAYGDS